MNLNLPVEIISIILPFAALFSKPVWSHAQILLLGAILATGKRTITSVLAVMGLSESEHFQNYPERIKPCSMVKFASKPNFINAHGSSVVTEWTNHHGNR